MFNEHILPRASSPEEVGVSSAAIVKMLEQIEESGAHEHGVMILRHGVVAFESFRDPYAATTPHIMYSVSKSVTSTAVGFAIEEGFLSLETKVLDVFPEYRPRKRDDRLERLNIHHLLSMQAGKMPNLLANKTKNEWLNHFFDAKWIFNPGEGWEYVNENIFLLCAILVRVTGMSVTEFLHPRLWEPLGVPTPYWETDPNGVESGGWGLFLSAESLAKFMLCYLNKGEFNGRQVIPREWASVAVLNHKNLKPGQAPSKEGGYGYCFYRQNSEHKSYRAEGMFSEIGLVFEDYDAVIVTVGGEINSGKSHRFIFDNFPEGFCEPCDATSVQDEVSNAVAQRTILPLRECGRSALEEAIHNKTFRLRKNRLLNMLGFPMSVLPLAATYMTKDRAGNIDNIRFEFSPLECAMSWSEGDEQNTVICGMDGSFRVSMIRLASTTYTAYGCAAWSGEKTLTVWILPIESIGMRMLEFTFNGNAVTMRPTTSPPLSTMINAVSDGAKDVLKKEWLVRLARVAVRVAEKKMEPLHKGRQLKK